MMSKYKAKIIIGALILGAIILIVGLYWRQEKASEPELKVVFFDVGQGDSTYIRTGEGFDILIDGGPDKEVLMGLTREMPFYDRRIELMMVTHAHDDHYGGLISVLERYEVDRVMMTSGEEADGSWGEFLTQLKTEGAMVEEARQGQEVAFGAGIMYILMPNKKFEHDQNLNNRSIVSQLNWRGQTMLFTGDAETAVEAELVKLARSSPPWRQRVSGRVLKAGHHGSKSSSTAEFLDLVMPSHVIISAGQNNRYGHPHAEVLNRLTSMGFEIFQTSEWGDIKYVYQNGEFLRQR